jgi:hypothetical protein
MCRSRHVIQPMLDPRFLSDLASCDVASDNYRALIYVGTWRRRDGRSLTTTRMMS